VPDQPKIRVVVSVIEKNGRYLITRRRPTAVLPLLWEFPGGKVEPGETDAQALKREMKERLDADVEVGDLITNKDHAYEGYTIALYVYSAKLLSPELTVKAVHEFKWVRSDEFDQYPFPPVDQATVDKLLGFGQ